MGFLGNFGPLKWSPRAIIKVRDVYPMEYEKCQLKLLILRAEIEHDWDKIEQDIWVLQSKKFPFFPDFNLFLFIFQVSQSSTVG